MRWGYSSDLPLSLVGHTLRDDANPQGSPGGVVDNLETVTRRRKAEEGKGEMDRFL